MQHERAVILVDHGSRRQEANALLDDVAARVGAALGGTPVIAAHMELAEPSIAAAFQLAAERGARDVVVVPFFLSPGRHTSEDVPRLCAEAAAAAGGLTWSLTDPLGTHALIVPLIVRLIAEQAARQGAGQA